MQGWRGSISLSVVEVIIAELTSYTEVFFSPKLHLQIHGFPRLCRVDEYCARKFQSVKQCLKLTIVIAFRYRWGLAGYG